MWPQHSCPDKRHLCLPALPCQLCAQLLVGVALARPPRNRNESAYLCRSLFYAQSKYGVDMPGNGSASESRYEFDKQRLAFGSSSKTGRGFGRRPRQSAGNLLATRASVPAPTTSAHVRSPHRESMTQFGDPKYPDREAGSIPGGWTGLTNSLGDRLAADELNGITVQHLAISTPHVQSECNEDTSCLSNRREASSLRTNCARFYK